MLSANLLMRGFAKRGDGPNLFPDFRNWPTLLGRNGEGDPYYTDGEIDIASSRR